MAAAVNCLVAADVAMTNFAITDLHCDLLAYLAFCDGRTVHDEASLCSMAGLKAGHVTKQVMAVFSTTDPTSVAFGLKQNAIYERQVQPHIPSRLAIENAACFCTEAEKLSAGLERLDKFNQPLYIGMTWNGENRFGGGCGSDVGLKDDGKELVQLMAHKGIALDFSHTSDSLAEDLLNYIDAKSLKIKVIASHSNFRTVCKQPRNLPDWLATEIIGRGGVIGMNWVERFLGPHGITSYIEQLSYGLSLGGEKALVCGADFYYAFDGNVPRPKELANKSPFSKELGQAKDYAKLMPIVQEKFGAAFTKRLCQENVADVLGL